MKQLTRVFLATLVIVLIISVPACRTRKTPPPTPVVENTAPPVPPPPPPPADTTVSQPTDFVQDTAPVEEVIPTDVEELNKWAQSKGYIRDAFFNYDEATLDDAAQTALTTSANWLKGRDGAGYNLLIEGHCDERGTEQYNLALGDRRANTAKDYLVTLGVEAGRIRTVSYGEERPFEEGHNDASWAQNRRAHLVLVR